MEGVWGNREVPPASSTGSSNADHGGSLGGPVARARELIEGRQCVVRIEWGEVQPRAADQDTFLAKHTWEEYAEWHPGLTEGARDGTKARYAFVYGDFRRVHRSGIIACHYRAAEWEHKEIELAAHELLQLLDRMRA